MTSGDEPSPKLVAASGVSSLLFMAALIFSNSSLSFSTGSSLRSSRNASKSFAEISLFSSSMACSVSSLEGTTGVSSVGDLSGSETCCASFALAPVTSGGPSCEIVCSSMAGSASAAAATASFLLSLSFFLAAASRAASSSRMSSFCCATTSNFSFRIVGSDCFSSSVATSRMISLSTSLSNPEMASARPVRFLSASSAPSPAGFFLWNMSSRKKKDRLMTSKEIGTFLLTLRSNHCCNTSL
mmetsp:Transcript_19942/g.41643  ORF Transcript_19942/g.41643 Transcript_19942/m.41643 type:complete len:242 (+) Transcript_19942:2964-3689(+)